MDLKTCGAHVYARHPSTVVLCAAYALPGDEEPRLWRRGEPCPPEIVAHIAAGGRIRAFNARGFEALIWAFVCVARMGWPPVPYEQWVCTMHEALALGLPGKMEKLAVALKLPVRKDAAGTKLINELCTGKAQADGGHTWRDDAERLSRLEIYCMQDVRVERSAAARIARLSPGEAALVELDTKINARGVGVDLQLVEALLWLTAEAKADLDARMRRVTNGAVATTAALPSLKKWLGAQGWGSGALDKDGIGQILGDAELPPAVREALTLRQAAAKSSTAKLAAMVGYGTGHGAGQRMRGMFAYFGAATGRWAGRGPQPHNLPRAKFKDPEAVIRDVMFLYAAGYGPGTPQWELFESAYGDVFAVVSKLLRSCIVPGRGNLLHSCDLAGIESRVLAWLAGEGWKLQLFRDGGDPYLAGVGATLGRQIGKVAELACGFQGAVGAFQAMAKGYQVELPDAVALQAVQGWRAAHPKTVRLWYAMNDAAIEATRLGQEGRGAAVPVLESGVGSRLVFWHSGGHLWLRLPSGRALRYANARIDTSYTPAGDARDCVIFDTVDNRPKGTKQWGPVQLYGGLLAENATQAVARDVLVLGMREVERRGLPVVMHVHDELVVEAPADQADASDTLLDAMLAGPRAAPWTRGLPLDAEVDRNLTRYRK